MYHKSFHAYYQTAYTHICTYTVYVCDIVVYHIIVHTVYYYVCVYVYDLKVELCTLLFPDSLVLWASTYMYIYSSSVAVHVTYTNPM